MLLELYSLFRESMVTRRTGLKWGEDLEKACGHVTESALVTANT